jgi:NTP pyrophosphatase (non-canonical NTP hydrolase)
MPDDEEQVMTDQGGALPRYQQTVAAFVAAHTLDAPVETRVLDLASEAGEVAKEVVRGTAYGRETFRPTVGWETELGDVFFSLICVANRTGVDLDVALADALERYRRRLERAGTAASDAESIA